MDKTLEMNMQIADRLNHARWTLERQLTWIAAADAKVGVVIALHVAMVGGLGAAYTAANADRSAWVNVMTAGYAFFVVWSVICAVMALWPRTDGPKSSMVYFGCVAKSRCDQYVEDFGKKDEAYFLADLAEQTHRNAQIAQAKIAHVGQAMKVAFASAPFWLVAVALLVMPK